MSINIEAAYAAYDKDKRTNGPDDFDAFRDAVTPLRRHIQFIPNKPDMVSSFGVSMHRIDELDQQMQTMVRDGKHFGEVIEHFTNSPDVSDAELVAIVFAMGWFFRSNELAGPAEGVAP